MKTPTKIWNKYFKISVVLAASISCLSMTSINHYNLLSDDDQEMEAVDQEGPSVLSSGFHVTPQWESFNTWQCFSTETIQPECSELDYGAIHVPTLRMREGTTLYDFSLEPEPDLDCEQTLAKWTALLENQRSFCVYAAHLQIYPDNPFESEGITEWHLWIVDQIRTNNGYWKWADTEEESSDENDQVESEAKD
jgi:hypothetical protein